MYGSVSACVSDIAVGDLVFFKHSYWSSFFGGFVSAVTASNPSKLYHVAIVERASPLVLVEATKGYGVSEKEYSAIQLDSELVEFLSVNVSSDIKHEAVSLAKSLVGKGYNYLFHHNSTETNDPTFYCSQLVQYVYNKAAGEEMFPSSPMNFTNTDGEVLPYWQSYYSAYGATVPEGEPGTHPGSIYNSEFLIPIC